MTGPAVAYPGEPGSFAEEAALAARPGSRAVGLAGSRAVLEAVEAGEADGSDGTRVALEGGVLPIENVLGGTIHETYDLLLAHELHIVAEVVIPVRLCLAALPGERLDEIGRVYSHFQALAQAERFLSSRSWTLLTTYNTAAAGRLLVERGERGAGAVLSPRAAELLGLEILQRGVEDMPDDRTRFLVLGKGGSWWPPASAGGSMRTTLVLGLPNRPGALVRALAVLGEAGLNMSKLESRPARGRAWEYVFWLDLDTDASDPGAAAALEALRERTSFLRVLGSYPRSPEPAG